jgi:Dockerin type I domain
MRAKISVVHEARTTLLGFAFSLFLFLSSSSGDSSAPRATEADPESLNPGPDVIGGDLSSLQQFGSNGNQVGLAMGTDTCNGGDQELNFFTIPNTDHPVLAQNLYRMSRGAANDERFEQIGQSWGAHAFFALQSNGCGFGCTPASDGTHLGAGCSTADTASINSGPFNLGSRAWLNPFTGLFPSTANDHTGHTHTGTSHRILVNGTDLDTTMNPGATYYAEIQLVTPHESAWCQAHPGQCNMFNNASHRQFSVAGTTSFTFSPIGSTVRMIPAIDAWPGATIRTIEPAPGVDGRAFLAYKVTGPVAGLYHYEYAIYNQNLDRGIQSFSVPRLLIPDISGAELGGEQNIGFRAPPQHPGFPADGTQGNAGFSSAEWTFDASVTSLTWDSETFAQNPNANAIRWGTLYNFRFDSTTSPVASNATVGFFKAGAPITVAIEGPAPIGGPVRMISGTVVYCSNPSLNPVPGVTLTLTGSTSGSTLSDSSGNYAFSVINGGSFTVTPTKAGLAPGSNGINTLDVLAVQRHFLRIVPLTGCPLAAADVNGDSNITTVDVVAIQRFFLGLSTGIANVGRYQFNPTNRSYTQLTSDQTAQDYDTIVYGDVTPPFAVP